MNIGVIVTLAVLPLLFHGETMSAAQDEGAGAVVVRTTGSKQGFLGVSIRDMDAELAKKMKSKTVEGALVTAVEDDSPAEKAGIRKDDCIVEFNGRTISDIEDLQKSVRKTQPGTAATIVVMRGGQKKSLKVTVGSQPHSVVDLDRIFRLAVPRVGRGHYSFSFGPSTMYGLHLMELNSQLGEYFAAPNGRGVLVTEVEKGSAGDSAGFKAGDVIIHLGRETIEDLRDMTEGLDEYTEGKMVPIEILRKGDRKSLSLTVEENESLGWVPERTFRYSVPTPDTLIRKRLRQELERVRELKHLHEVEAIDIERLKHDLDAAKETIERQMQEFRKQLYSSSRDAQS